MKKLFENSVDFQYGLKRGDKTDIIGNKKRFLAKTQRPQRKRNKIFAFSALLRDPG